MSGIAPGGGGFSDRLAQALSKAKQGGSAKSAATAAETVAATAPPPDDYNNRLATAISKARGEPVPGEETQIEQPQAESGGPVGEGEYEVRAGDCISSIAYESGHFWETLWNEPANAELREAREDPNVLLEGDQLTVPELRRKDESLAPEQRHRFVRRGEPAMMRLRITEDEDWEPEEALEPEEAEDEDREPEQTLERGKDEDEDGEPDWPAEPTWEEDEQAAEDSEPRREVPRGGAPYTLEIDGRHTTGTTDADGFVREPIPPNARRGRLIIDPETPWELIIPLQFGEMDPITEIVGVKKRLNNLGFDCGDETGGQTDEFKAALEEFQKRHGLEVTGKPDPKTREALQAAQGS